MYKALILELQNCPDAEYGCSRCEFQKSVNCREKLMKKSADAIESLLKAARAMHLWIFNHSVDEQEAYDECGLSDEMNAELGYGGKLIIEVPKED